MILDIYTNSSECVDVLYASEINYFINTHHQYVFVEMIVAPRTDTSELVLSLDLAIAKRLEDMKGILRESHIYNNLAHLITEGADKKDDYIMTFQNSFSMEIHINSSYQARIH